MKSDITALATDLAHAPLWGLLATLVAYRIGLGANRLAKGSVLANPVLVAVSLLVALLLAAHIPYREYFAGAQFIHFLLGPATVALAVPMYRNLHHIRRTARALVPALVAGSLVSACGAALISRMCGAAPVVTASLIAHSATTPIAMSIAQHIGGDPSLTATFTLFTGIVGVLQIEVVMNLMRILDERAHGLAAGTAGHGLTTARMLSISETAGAFGGLAIGLNGVLTSLIAPLLAMLLT
ncbi:LrgB family protein [Paraburkholderia silviterrae]|uniref:LrgB family protein n=1 Tax=Paraburkholderia silviterrae TaxID=2528715 RepID=A0A4R5M9X3_9BURK|nr:LrgB family protein [Paraburkholderia silviterrae]TDG22797.1 LrgB family protein [Paraburkholderia silviterrae]